MGTWRTKKLLEETTVGLPGCIHYEVIDAHNVGTCQRCGQVKQYSFDAFEKPVLIKEGREEMKDTKEPDMRRQQLKEKGRFTPAALSELREIGVDAFAEKYGYRKQAKSVIVRAWERLTGTKTTREKASSAPHMDGKLPPLIAEAIKLLPPAGTPLPLERKNLLRQLIDCSIELSYGGK